MDERRHFVRYPCDMSVKIFGSSDESYLCEACDISEQGICLLVPKTAFSRLNTDGYNLRSGENVKISLPDTEGLNERSIVCSVAHGEAVKDGQYYMLGLHFEDYRAEARQFINDHLKHHQ